MNTIINKDKKIAIIGCGYWGTIITKTLIELGLKNIFIYDSSAKNLHALKKKYNTVKIIKNYSKILFDKDLTNLFFATPPSMNYSLVKQAIINNKIIFLEKPGVNKSSDLNKLIKLNKKFNSRVMFGYVYCFSDHIKYIKKIISKNVLGKLLYINFQRQNLGPIRNDVDVTYDLTSHDLSIILFLFGKLPKKISHIKYPILKKNLCDISNLHMKLDNTFIDINNNWINPTKIRKINIVGSKKMLSFDEMDLVNPIRIYNKYAKYPKIHEFNKKFFEAKALIYLGKNFSPKIKSSQSLLNEIKYFLKLKKKDRPITDFLFSLKILKFLETI